MNSNRDEIKQKIKAIINFKDRFISYYPELYLSTGNSFNPFIEDNKPSFLLDNDHGCDFGYDNKCYDIFDLYQLKHGCDFKTAFNELRIEAGISDPPKKSQAPFTKDKFVATYDYVDETNKLLYQNVRFEPKNFRQRRPDQNNPGKWIWKLGDTKRVPFRLPELLAASNDQPVMVCEGEKDALALAKMGFVATSVGSATSGCGNLVKHSVVDYFKGRPVVIIQDKDDDGRKYAKKAAQVYARVAKSVKIIEMPGEGIKDTADFYEKHGPDGKATIESIVAATAEYEPEALKPEKYQSKNVADKRYKPSKLTKFQKLDICFKGLGWKLFFDQNGEPWASVYLNGHYENMRVDSQQFKRLVRREFKSQFDDGVGFDIIDQVIDARLGDIEHSQRPRPLHVRMCWNATKDKILIDSGRPDWAIFEIGPDVWRMIYTDENPFKRARKTAAYRCTPETPRATWDNLFEFLRVRTDSQKTIIKMWLCLALFPETARPGAIINGPHGSAKTTLARKMKMLVDPATNERPNRFRRNEDDMIAPLANYAVTVLDNANQMTPEQSDLLCLSITGLDDEKRKLFTDGDVHNTDFMTTWIITGLSNPGKAGDLLSRVFILETEIIPKNEKIPDDKINKLAQRYTAGIQALIFDCMSESLRNAESVKTDELNRMAQANIYSLAMADGLGLTQEDIKAVWSANRDEQQAEVSSGEILTELIPEFLEKKKGKWAGTASELLEEMYSEMEIDKMSGKKSFPSTAVHLSRRLNTIIENLLERKIIVNTTKEGGARVKQFYDSDLYETNPFLGESKSAKQNQYTQPSLSEETGKNGDNGDITKNKEFIFSCNICPHYEGEDYCDKFNGLADPEICPFIQCKTLPPKFKETIANC